MATKKQRKRGATQKKLAKNKIAQSNVTALPAGLTLQNIPGDAHCIFHAVGLYLGRDAELLRNIVSAYMDKNFDKLKSFFVGTEDEFREHIQAIKTTDKWGGNLEIEAIQSAMRRPIIIIQKNGNQPIIPNINKYPGDPIFICYNGINHYDGLIIKDGFDGKQILLDLIGKNQSIQTQKPPAAASMQKKISCET